MIKKTLELQGQNKAVIVVHTWQPEAAIIGGMHILHGMAEHGERYEDFAQFMVANGYAVWVQDHRQHGLSISHDTFGIFDETDTWMAMVEDVELVQLAFHQAFPEMAMHMLGHSMGSALLRGYLQTKRAEIDTAIIMGSPSVNKPLLKAGQLMGTVLEWLKPKVASPFMNTLSVGKFNKAINHPQTPFDWISKDSSIVNRYAKDPLCGYAYNPRFYSELSRGMIRVNTRVQMAKYPEVKTLFISGAEDPAGDKGKGVKAISHQYNKLGKNHKLVMMPNMRHEVLNEVDKSQTYHLVLEFIQG